MITSEMRLSKNAGLVKHVIYHLPESAKKNPPEQTGGILTMSQTASAVYKPD